MDFNQEKYKKEILDALEDIRKALEEKEITVNGILKVSDVAGYIDEIGGKTAKVTLKINTRTWTLNPAYITCCKGGGNYQDNAAFSGDVVEQKTLSMPNTNTNYSITFENLKVGQSYHFYIRPNSSTGAGSSNGIRELNVVVITCSEAREYTLTAQLNAGTSLGDPPNPDGPGIESLPVGEVKVEV